MVMEAIPKEVFYRFYSARISDEDSNTFMMAGPGYKTLEGFKSKGSNNKSRDHYTTQNIDMVADAI